MSTLATAWMLGCLTGWFMGVTVASRRRPTCRELMRDPVRQPSFAELLMPLVRDRDPDWRRSFTHENTSRPSGPPPLKLRRSDTAASTRSAPTTPKPNIIPRGQSPVGYQPRPQQGTPNPTPSEP